MTGDSVIKNIPRDSIKDTEILPYPGKTLAFLADRIISGEVQIKDRTAILLHLGTNDVDNMIKNNSERERQLNYQGHSSITVITVEHIVQQVKGLVHVIRERNSHAKIVIFINSAQTKRL